MQGILIPNGPLVNTQSVNSSEVPEYRPRFR